MLRRPIFFDGVSFRWLATLIVLTKAKFEVGKDKEAFVTGYGTLKALAIETPTKDESVWYDALPVFDIYKEWQDGTWY